jgi:hypothetical protein
MSYPPGSYKINPETREMAVRTQLPEDGSFANMAWLRITSRGAHNASAAEVESWVDIPTEFLTALIEGASNG